MKHEIFTLITQVAGYQPLSALHPEVQVSADDEIRGCAWHNRKLESIKTRYTESVRV